MDGVLTPQRRDAKILRTIKDFIIFMRVDELFPFHLLDEVYRDASRVTDERNYGGQIGDYEYEVYKFKKSTAIESIEITKNNPAYIRVTDRLTITFKNDIDIDGNILDTIYLSDYSIRGERISMTKYLVYDEGGIVSCIVDEENTDEHTEIATSEMVNVNRLFIDVEKVYDFLELVPHIEIDKNDIIDISKSVPYMGMNNHGERISTNCKVSIQSDPVINEGIIIIDMYNGRYALVMRYDFRQYELSRICLHHKIGTESGIHYNYSILDNALDVSIHHKDDEFEDRDFIPIK